MIGWPTNYTQTHCSVAVHAGFEPVRPGQRRGKKAYGCSRFKKMKSVAAQAATLSAADLGFLVTDTIAAIPKPHKPTYPVTYQLPKMKRWMSWFIMTMKKSMNKAMPAKLR